MGFFHGFKRSAVLKAQNHNTLHFEVFYFTDKATVYNIEIALSFIFTA